MRCPVVTVFPEVALRTRTVRWRVRRQSVTESQPVRGRYCVMYIYSYSSLIERACLCADVPRGVNQPTKYTQRCCTDCLVRMTNAFRITTHAATFGCPVQMTGAPVSCVHMWTIDFPFPSKPLQLCVRRGYSFSQREILSRYCVLTVGIAEVADNDRYRQFGVVKTPQTMGRTCACCDHTSYWHNAWFHEASRPYNMCCWKEETNLKQADCLRTK